jgi:hypothetical protein
LAIGSAAVAVLLVRELRGAERVSEERAFAKWMRSSMNKNIT